MTPEPALLNSRSRGGASGGRPKKRRVPGSSKNGLRGAATVPRTAMLTTAGDARLITGAKEGSAVCAKTGAESASVAPASVAARIFFMRYNLDGARNLTGPGSYKFRRARALIFPRAGARVNKLCVFCAVSMHTRCCVARKIAPDRSRPGRGPETASNDIYKALKINLFYSRVFSIRKFLTHRPIGNNFAT